MGDIYPVVKVAAVQAASVFLDRAGSTEKACRLIREAGENGARVIGFPEGFIPAHPVWYHHHAATGTVSNRLATELFKNAVEIPGPEVNALCRAARDADAYVVVGVCEKIPNTIGTMFNSQLYIAPDGTLIGKHQKIMPTVGERLVHMGGFGDTFGAFQTEFGPMSALICGENSNPLAVARSRLQRRLLHRRAQQPDHRRPPGRGGRHSLCRLQSRDRHPDEAQARFRRPLQQAGHFPPAHQPGGATALFGSRRAAGIGGRTGPRARGAA